MSSDPVATALGSNPTLGAKFETFRSAAHDALGEELTNQVRRVVAQVHGLDMAPGDEKRAVLSESRPCLDYARRIPFEHTAISDAEAAAVVDELGEDRFVAFSVVAALADAECRAAKVGLTDLAVA